MDTHVVMGWANLFGSEEGQEIYGFAGELGLASTLAGANFFPIHLN